MDRTHGGHIIACHPGCWNRWFSACGDRNKRRSDQVLARSDAGPGYVPLAPWLSGMSASCSGTGCVGLDQDVIGAIFEDLQLAGKWPFAHLITIDWYADVAACSCRNGLECSMEALVLAIGLWMPGRLNVSRIPSRTIQIRSGVSSPGFRGASQGAPSSALICRGSPYRLNISVRCSCAGSVR